MSQATKPPIVSQNGDEDKTWTIGVGDQLTGGQTATLPVTRLFKAGVQVVLLDSPTIGGLSDVVKQRIRAGALTQGTYELRALFTPSGTSDVLERILKIYCRTPVTGAPPGFLEDGGIPGTSGSFDDGGTP